MANKMSVKNLLGLKETGISDFEIMSKVKAAQSHDLDEVDFLTEDGSVVKIHLPHLEFDPMMDIIY